MYAHRLDYKVVEYAVRRVPDSTPFLRAPAKTKTFSVRKCISARTLEALVLFRHHGPGLEPIQNYVDA